MKAIARLALILALAIFPSIALAQLDPDGTFTDGQSAYKDENFFIAASDFVAFCRVSPKDDNADYARVFIWLAQTRSNLKAKADAELSHALTATWNSKPDAWISKIAAFFLNRITETDLFDASNHAGEETVNQQRCEAWYYAGIKRLIAGDEGTAVEYFDNCVHTGEDSFIEYDFAQAQLRALGHGD